MKITKGDLKSRMTNNRKYDQFLKIVYSQMVVQRKTTNSTKRWRLIKSSYLNHEK